MCRHNFAVTQFIEKLKKNESIACIAFMNLEKRLKIVDRKVLWQAQSMFSIERFVSAMKKSLYEQSSPCKMVSDNVLG